MAKILYEIDTDNLFDNTTATQDKEVLKDLTWEDEPIEVKVAIPMEYYVNKHLI